MIFIEKDFKSNCFKIYENDQWIPWKLLKLSIKDTIYLWYMWQIFIATLRAFIKQFYDFLMFKKIIKTYKNYKEILKHNFGCCRAWTNHHLITCLTPWTTWPHSLAPQRRENSLNMLLWKLPSKFVEITGKNFSSNWCKS